MYTFEEFLEKINFSYDNWDDYSYKTTAENLFLRFRSKNEVTTQLHRMATEGGKYLDEFNLKFKDKENIILDIDVKPLGLPPKNTYCIVGKNGTGKSYFLKNIAKSVLKEETSSYVLEIENDKNLENVIFISYSPFDDTIDIKNKDNFYQIGLNSVNIKEKETIFDYFNRELVDNIVAIQNPVAIKSKELWEEILEKFSYEEWVRNLLRKLSNLDQKIENDLSETKEFLKTEIEKLSSGQKIVLLSLTSLSLKVKEKTFVLVDEPELFLHPSMIKSYIRALIEIATRNNGICIIATHNPIVLQEIQTSCVKIIKIMGR